MKVKRKNVLLLFLVLGSILIVMESFLLFRTSVKKQNAKKEKWDIVKETCHENLCVHTVTVVNKKQEHYIQFRIKNKGEESNEEQLLQLVLDGNLIKKFYCPSLSKNKASEIKIHLDSKTLKTLKDYRLEAISR